MVAFPNPRPRPPYHMHDMILAQPEFVRETLGRVRDADAKAFLGPPRRILVTGCGTSFHAAMYGARVLQSAFESERVVEAVHAYDLLHGHAVPPGSTVLGVSHSGRTSTTNQALGVAARSGARVLALCGLPDTPMASVAEELLVIGSVHDHSWANTMSYTSQLTALAWLASTINRGSAGGLKESLGSLPECLARTLRIEDTIRRLARSLSRRRRITFLGSGLDEITALEGALKVRETCSVPACAYHTEQFLHGPFLSLDREESVVVLRSRDDGDRAEAIRRGLARTGSRVVTVGDGDRVDVRVPAIDRTLRPILSVVPLQFLAYDMALEKGTNPDVMRSEVRGYQAGLERLFA